MRKRGCIGCTGCDRNATKESADQYILASVSSVISMQCVNAISRLFSGSSRNRVLVISQGVVFVYVQLSSMASDKHCVDLMFVK